MGAIILTIHLKLTIQILPTMSKCQGKQKTKKSEFNGFDGAAEASPD
jgi:hypothetical protein